MLAIDVALNSGNEKAIGVLKSYGADIENEIDGKSRLLRAVKEGDIRKTELLLKQGANVNTKNGKALDLATQQDNHSMAQLLKENKAKTSLEIKIRLAVLVTLTIITLGLTLVVYSIMKGIRGIATQKTGSALNEVESTRVTPSIQKA